MAKKVEFRDFHELIIRTAEDANKEVWIHLSTIRIAYRGVVGLKDNVISSDFLSEPGVKCLFVFAIYKKGIGSYDIATDGSKYYDVSMRSIGDPGSLMIWESSRRAIRNPHVLDQEAIKYIIKNLKEENFKPFGK